ncbi:MAG: hypothetical protein BWY98_01216 [Tenericutes bacterium ADurb.BinA155]|nr:MAG: hypothetical protein BWY98_01216 [Tenericutes bacterium ADurb.BinA155]
MKVLSDWEEIKLAKLISYPLIAISGLFVIVLCCSFAFNNFSGLGLGTHGFLYDLVNSAFTF